MSSSMLNRRLSADHYPCSDAAITYAIEDLGVQHIIVLGHYDCKAAKRAIAGMKKENAISRWIKPIADLYKHARR